MIGGNPNNFITLEEDRSMDTEDHGNIDFGEGAKIDCDHSPGEPDPCSP